MGEVVDIVHWVEDSVNKTLRQRSHCCHALLAQQLVLGGIELVECLLKAVRLLLNLVFLLPYLRCSLLHDILQPHLFLQEACHAPTYHHHYEQCEEHYIYEDKIPAHIYRIAHHDVYHRGLYLTSVAVACHHLEGVASRAWVGECHRGRFAPFRPFVVAAQAITVLRVAKR